MKKYITFVLATAICQAVTAQSVKGSPLSFKTANLSDNSRQDFSFLDRLYLIAKTINPHSSIIPNGDTLLIGFDLPPWNKLSDSLLLEYAKTYYDAFSVAMTKDSMKFKMIGVQVCNDPFHCGTAWYDMSTHDFTVKHPLKERMQFFFQPSFWPCNVHVTQMYNSKKTMVLYYYIDSNYVYAGPDYIQSFSQSASAIISDLIYKSPPKIRKSYENLIVLFCCNGRLAYFWRYPINNERRSSLYKIKYYESSKAP